MEQNELGIRSSHNLFCNALSETCFCASIHKAASIHDNLMLRASRGFSNYNLVTSIRRGGVNKSSLFNSQALRHASQYRSNSVLSFECDKVTDYFIRVCILPFYT